MIKPVVIISDSAPRAELETDLHVWDETTFRQNADALGKLLLDSHRDFYQFPWTDFWVKLDTFSVLLETRVPLDMKNKWTLGNDINAILVSSEGQKIDDLVAKAANLVAIVSTGPAVTAQTQAKVFNVASIAEAVSTIQKAVDGEI